MRKEGWYIAQYTMEHDLEIVKCDGSDSRENISVTGSDLTYADSEFWYMDKEPMDLSENYRAKYEKAINVIRRFDAGIISMYDL